MAAPRYSYVPPMDSQISTSYPPPPPPQDEKKQFSADVEECGPLPPSNGLLMSATPSSKAGRATFWLRSIVHKYWILEAAASIFSLLIFAIIIGMLAWYDNTYYGDASTASPNKRPTLFPVLAILGAVMRASMLLPVATAIGQLKWGWFRAGRRLLDIERFDEAARGILGSARLIWTLRFRSIAAVGAALTILALPLDALIQSAVLLPTMLQVNDLEYVGYPNITNQTSMPRSTWYNDSQIMESADTPWPVTPLINAIKFGVSYDNGLDDFINAVTKIDCPTGYCKFNTSQTLAIGSQCIDVTKVIENVPAQGDFAEYQTLSSTNLEFYINGGTDGNETYQRQIIAAESYTEWPEETYDVSVLYGPILGPLIVRTAMIMNFHGTETIAAECALYWYVHTTQEYSNDNTSFTLNATDIPTPFDYVKRPELTDNLWVLTPKQCFVEGELIPANNNSFYEDNCNFAIGNDAGAALQNMLLDPQDGFTGQSWLKDGELNEWTRTNDFVTNLYATGEALDTTSADALSSIELMWSNIAFAMSFTVRRSASLMVDGTTQYLDTRGTVYRPIIYWSITWPRLAAPAFVVVFSALFVLYTAVVTRQEYAWRRSALPLLFHGIEDTERVAFGDVRSMMTMQDVAEKLHVRLEEHVDAQGARFATQR